MNKRRRSEIKAGLFIDLGVLLVVLAVLFFGNRITTFRRPIHYHFHLKDAQGLVAGTKVFVAGIDAGKVDSLSMEPTTREVRVEMDVVPKFQDYLRRDSRVEVNTQGVLGDRAVYVSAGSDAEPAIGPGGEIAVRESPLLGGLVGRGDTVLRDLDRLIQDIDRFASRLNRDVDPKKANDALSKLDSILGKIDDGQGTLGAFVNDPALYDDAKALVGEANSNRILRNIVRKSVEDSEAKQKKGSG